MKYFLYNVKLFLNCKMLCVLFSCFFINVSYCADDFPNVLYGVKNGFEVYTAIPWFATVFPFFFMSGVYLGSKEETFIFSAYRTKNYLYHFVCYYITMIFAAILYCLLYGLIAIIFSGEFVDVVISIMLLFFNIIFIASVQWLIFSVKKSVNLSVCAVLVIILISIVFVDTKFNIGAWGMLVRSNFKLERGFDITVITTAQILLSFVCFISVPIIYKKKYIL